MLVIITDGKSEDPVDSYAKQIKSMGVEIFVLGTPPIHIPHFPLVVEDLKDCKTKKNLPVMTQCSNKGKFFASITLQASVDKLSDCLQ